MGQDPGQGRTALAGEQTPDELQRGIEQTRVDLGETVSALAYKTDVKARATQKLGELKHTAAGKVPTFGSGNDAETSSSPSFLTQARTTARQNPGALVAGVAFVGGFVFGRLRSR